MAKSQFPGKDTFDQAYAKSKNKKKTFISKKSGPADADGFKVLPKSAEKHNFTQADEKLNVEVINKYTMSKKSTFDSLYEDVMSDSHPDEIEHQDAEALGVHDGAEDGVGEDMDSVEGEEKDIKDVLRDAIESLQAALDKLEGAEGEEGEVEGDVEGAEGDIDHAEHDLEDGDEYKHGEFGEATDIEELKGGINYGKGDTNHPWQKVTPGSNKIGAETAKLYQGKKDGKVKTTDKVGFEETDETPLVHDPKGNLLDKKNDKVKNKHNTGDYIFKA